MFGGGGVVWTLTYKRKNHLSCHRIRTPVFPPQKGVCRVILSDFYTNYSILPTAKSSSSINHWSNTFRFRIMISRSLPGSGGLIMRYEIRNGDARGGAADNREVCSRVGGDKGRRETEKLVAGLLATKGDGQQGSWWKGWR
jgi:hypothetical protein